MTDRAPGNLQSAILNAVPAHIAVLDSTGDIVTVNEPWRRFAEQNGATPAATGVGVNYLKVCDDAASRGGLGATEVAAGIRQVLAGQVREFSFDYPCHAPSEQRWFRVVASPFGAAPDAGAVVMHLDTTAGRLAEEGLSALAMAQHSITTSTGSLQAIMTIVVEHVLALTRATGSVVAAVEGESVVYRCVGGTMTGREGVAAGRTSSLSGRVVAEAATLHAADTETDSSVDRELCRRLGIRSLLIVPIRAGGHIWGVLKAVSAEPDVFGTRDVHHLQILAESFGGVVAKAQADERQRAVAEQYRLLFKHHPHPMWTYDVNTLEILAVNDAAVDRYGYTEDEFLAMTILDVRPDEDRDDVRLAAAARRTGRTFGLWRHRTKAGDVIDVEVSSDSLTFDGRPARIVLAHDVTDRRRAEMRLRESEARFRQLAENIAEVFWIVEPDGGRLIYVSPAYEAVWGRALEDLYADPAIWHAAIHPDDRDRIRIAQQRLVGFDETYRVVRPDGDVRWIHDRAFPVRDVAGHVFRLVGIAADVTDRRIADERISEQAKLLDQANDAISVRDLNHRVIFWNRGGERVFGWSAEEMVGQRAPDVLATDVDALEAAQQATLADGEWSGELEKQTKAGHRIILAARWTLLRDAEGLPRSILAIETDITERRRVEQQFLRAQRMESVGTLAGGIAHDLNNVLAPILMAIEGLREQVSQDDGVELLDILQASAQRGADLVRQVLTFARGVEGQRVAVDLPVLTRDLTKVLRETFPKSINLRLDVAPEAWTVTGDPTQLHQVILNLCVNARDAMPDGGDLVVAIENIVLDDTYVAMNPGAQAGAHVKIKVTDTGIGMSKDIVDRIFEPFFTTKELGQGTGLGLSTTSAIVRSHGGFINVYSEPGRGTKFHVYLPARASVAEIDRAATEQTMFPHGHGETILVVDDEVAIREVARRTLERFGYKVMLASNGAEAIGVYASHRGTIDLVLTDMAMPIMDGPALIIALKAVNPDVLIVGSSGLRSHGGAAKAVGAGVKWFVAKPYTAEAILRTLHDALREIA
jgi:PAS domain S-box-containing protein